MPIYLRAAFCAILLLLVAFPADAEPLRVVVPVGRQPSLTAPGTAAAMHDIRKIPGGAAVVPAKNFQNTYALSMKDMLAATPGVFAQPRWGEESRLSIRGSGLSRGFHLRGLMILQDGIPFNFADGSSDFQELDPLALQHIEIYRGGQALRYGGATLGGAVNAITPTARTLGHEAMLRFEGGSFETKRSHAQGGHIFGDTDVFGAITHTLSNGYRQQNEQDNTRFNGNAGVMLAPGVETRFYVSWNDLNQEIPGTVSKADALHRPTRVPAINVLDDYARDIRSLRLANRTVFDLGGNTTVEIGGYANDKQLYHPIFQVIDQDSLDTGLFARLRRDDAVLGINLGRGANYADRYENEGGNRGTMRANGRQLARNVEIYGEDRLNLTPEWSLIGGFQAALADRQYTDFINSVNDADTVFRSFNPKFGVMWKPQADTQVYASLTRSSEVPTFSELVQGAIPGFVPVGLQTAWTAEIGTRGNAGAWGWDATVYHARVKDEMLQFTTGPDIPAATFNADDTIHQGIELGLSYQLSDTLNFQAIYNFSDFRFDGDRQFGDDALAGAPPHQIRVAMEYKKDGFSIEPNIEWIPAAPYVDYANTLKADAYAVAGIKAAWDVAEGASFFVDARNLTNTRYIPSFSTITDARTANTAVFYPGDGRSVFAGLKVKF